MNKSKRLKFVTRNVVAKSDGAPRPFLGLENVEPETGRLVGEVEEKAATDCLLAMKGDVLFGKLRPYLAKSFRADAEVSCTSEFMVLRPGAGTDSRFLEYITRSRRWLDWSISTSYGSKMPRTSWDAMAALTVDLPPLRRQHEIASFLDRETAKIDALIVKQQQLIATLHEDRAATIHSAVTKGLNRDAWMKKSDVEWIGFIPKSWTIQRMSWLFNVISSGTTPDSKNSSYYGGEVNWVTTGELREGSISDTTSKVSSSALADHSALRVYSPGSLVIAMYGATIGRLGILSAPACTNQACCVFAEPKQANIKFMFYILLAAREHLLVLASGGGQPNINQDKLRALRVPTPSMEEQREIARFLDIRCAKIDALVSKSAEMIATLREYRSALITDAVNGKIDLRGVA